MLFKKIPYLTIAIFGYGLFLTLFYFYSPASFLEDHSVENFQLLLLFACCVTSFLNLRRSVWFRYRPFCVLAGIGCLFLFLEEISYGQRIFNISTPNFFLLHNDSKELNLHNLDHGFLQSLMYALLLSWALISLLKKTSSLKSLIAKWIPVYDLEINILTILLYISTQILSYNILSYTFPEVFEVLWYTFFLILFLSNPQQSEF